MVLNDLLTKQKVFTQLILKDGDKELPKELKVKIMRIRLALTKAKKNFDEEIQEFIRELTTDEFKSLQEKQDRTSEEDARLDELSQQMNSEYKIYMTQKSEEEIAFIDDSITEDEYADIVEVNAGNNVEINGVKVPAVELLEAVYELFVK